MLRSTASDLFMLIALRIVLVLCQMRHFSKFVITFWFCTPSLAYYSIFRAKSFLLNVTIFFYFSRVMAPTRRRGRASSRPAPNTCSQCRVFIPRTATLCGQCTLQQQSLETDNTSNTAPSSPPAFFQPPAPALCTICKRNERSLGSLCSFCSPLSLSTLLSTECHKCRRMPSTALNATPIRDIRRTAFGCVVTGSSDETVNLCNECVLYSMHGSQSTWAAAWPSVLIDFLTGKFNGSVCSKPFHEVLPNSIMQQYQHLLPRSISDNESIFDDLTSKVHHFNELKEGLTIKGVRDAHDKYCFPEVRCPFGCSEFVGETGLVPLQYFLQKLDPKFKFGNTNWKHKLACVRPDWLEGYSHNDMFHIKPHLFNDEVEGLCIATCSFHNGGCQKQFVHPPTNPTGRLPSKFPDRLGPATISYNCYKPAKANFSTHTYSMGVAKGNFAGVSSTTIGSKRKWDVAFGKVDVIRESLCCSKRRDVKPLLQKLVQKRELSQELCDSIASTDSLPNLETINKCLQNTTSVPFESSMAVKDMQEKGTEVSYFPLFAHDFDNYGCQPPDLAINNPDHLHLWSFSVMFSVSCSFHAALHSSTSTEYAADLKKLFALMFCHNNKLFGTKQKHELLSCLQNLSSAVAGDLSQTLSSFLTEIPFCNNYEIHDRAIVESALMSNGHGDVVSFVNNCERSSSDSFLPDRLVTQGGLVTYELRSITVLDGATAKVVIRHGKQYCCWWIYSSDSKQPVKIDINDSAVMGKFHSNWKSCHYEVIDSAKIRESKYQYLEYLGGQGRFICANHHVPLTVINRKRSIICCFEEQCHRKAAWLCPEDNCSSSVCRTHFKTHSVSSDRLFIKPTATVPSTPPESSELNEISDTLSDVSEPESEIDEFAFLNFATDCGQVNVAEGMHTTDSGDVPTVVDMFDRSIPTHVLLNSDCHVLQRHSLRNERNKSSSRFLQNIVASSPGESVPLLYPDAALFPTQFYHQQEDNTYTGALPAPLYNHTQSKKFNFATVEDHKRTALLNPSLLQSTDVRSIQTSFDTVFNQCLSFSDTRVVLNRGFQEVKEKKQKSIAPDDKRLQFDNADSRVRVNELAALLSQNPATFFLTLTCNQSEHFGVAPIFRALEQKYNKNNKEEWEKAVQAEIVLLTRAWYRSAVTLMHYIENSPEKPLGTVSKLWYRIEFQSTKGNLPHIHAVIWTEETREELQHKVSCSGSSALFELRKIANETDLIRDDNVFDLWNLLMTVQTHSCEKAGFRCHKVVKNDGESVCRVPKYPRSNVYSWRRVPSCHSDEALQKLFELDLAVPSTTRDNTYDVCSSLQGGKYEYPASSDEHLSPFNALLFVVTKSSQNLQICDEYLSARYIAKYAAGIEERSDARVDPVTFREIKVPTKGMRNIKITGVKLRTKETERKTLVQIIPLVESIWWLLDFSYVYSSVSFIHMSTHEKTERSTFLKRKSNTQQSVSLPLHVTKTFTLPPNRQFTQSQLLLLNDYLTSDYTNCKMSIFSGRPPALLFVDNPSKYFTWFKRSPVKQPEHKLKTDVNTSLWIDIFGFAVYLRKCYLEDFQNYWQQVTSEGHQNLHKFNADTSLLFLQNDALGLKTTDDSQVQIVTSNIVPTNPCKFLIHFVLSYGRFETELDLFNQSNLLEVYRYSKLLPHGTSNNHQDAYTLIRKYVLSELKFLPGASRSFDRHLLASFDVFTSFVLNQQIHNYGLPLVLHREISDEAEMSYLSFHKEKKERCVQGCLLNAALEPLVCHQHQFINATRQNPFKYTFSFPRADGQSDESYAFQQHVLNKSLASLESFMHGNVGFVKHQLCLGRPGSGKTLVCTMLFMEAIARGLNCSITCLSGERAQQLGGEHVHKMFKFRVNKAQVPEHMASQSINSLLRDVTRFTDLERLEVLFIDEVGQLNTEILCAMEIVLQHVRNNRLPMGGIFTIMSGDPKQLKPPDGSLVWLSPKMLTNYEFFYFAHYVRASPGPLRELLARLDQTQITSKEASEIASAITSNCILKETWNEVADNFTMRVFSTRAAEQQAVKQHSEKIRNDPLTPYVTFDAVDEESSTGSSIWLPASSQNSLFIDNHSITPNKIIIYKGVFIRFTANIANIHARQGQLGIILEVPSDNATLLEVFIAPPGCRSAVNIDENCLIGSGWRKTVVAKVFTPVLKNNTSFLRRYFFPIKNYVASTIHKCIGDTFPSIVTKISLSDKHFKIWDKEQLLVLLSRVSKLQDITFVGNESDLHSTLVTIIQQESCYTNYINNLLSKLAAAPSNSSSSSINVLTTNYLPWNVVLPEDETGFVYLLVSTKMPNVFYIGETDNIRRSLRQHNCGNGASATRPIERRPWGVLALATGFSTSNMAINEQQRKRLESTLNYKCSTIGPNVTSRIIFSMFEECAKRFADTNDLVINVIQCGSL